MDRLEQMKIMSERLSKKCSGYPCIRCPLKENTSNFCYSFDDIKDYDILKEHCKIMGIDISDLIGFTKFEIEPGYLLQLKGGKFVIAMGEKRNLFFHYFDVANSKLNDYAFCLDDIKDDFTALASVAIITVYGHTFSKSLGLNDRLILWERNGSECKIYNIETDGQSIKIQPNANTYLTENNDGDIFIENTSDNEEYICIKHENLPGLIAALQEIQGLYEKEKK